MSEHILASPSSLNRLSRIKLTLISTGQVQYGNYLAKLLQNQHITYNLRWRRVLSLSRNTERYVKQDIRIIFHSQF